MSRFYSGLRRAYLYVPSSNERMLEKSMSETASDVLPYDLEDSVAPAAGARENLTRFLAKPHKLSASKVAVRVNGISTSFFEDDISEILRIPTVGAIVMPKIHSAEDLEDVLEKVRKAALRTSRASRVKPMWNLRDIASWTFKTGPDGAIVSALSTDCANTSIIRSSLREELLYIRSQIVLAAKAFELEAIDMVCINCRDNEHFKMSRRQKANWKVEVVQSTSVQIVMRYLDAVG
ncbi:Pyruvate/Phosphoenolpyruvate kinase-like domain-containing protein [Mycena floridula]|nr:Pyruvate/Phosphoenolpyruvate kinase-like domain-containing protein [Mycena floridula]